MLSDAGVALAPEAQAALHMTNARAHLMNADTKKAREQLKAAAAAGGGEEVARRAKVLGEIAELIEGNK
jgi:hypothetical protein